MFFIGQKVVTIGNFEELRKVWGFNYPRLGEVLTIRDIKSHQERNCFDYFTIGSVKQIKDPLLFGRLKDSPDRYFIAQWSTDLCLDDLI